MRYYRDQKIPGDFILSNEKNIFIYIILSHGVIRIIASPEYFTGLNGVGAAAKLTFTITGSDTLSFRQSSVFKDSDNHTINILQRVEGIIEVVE